MAKWITEGVAGIYPWLISIEEKLERILSDQDTLNGYVTRLTAAVAEVSAEIAALKAQPAAAALDFSGLDTAVSGVEGLEPPVVAAPPVDETPAS